MGNLATKMSALFFCLFLLSTIPALADTTIDSTGTTVHFKKSDVIRLPAYGSFELAGQQTGITPKRNFLHLRGGR